ncbi:MAG: T9SS type A sorting domain-containing protein, partial [Bacteroidota bacterium]
RTNQMFDVYSTYSGTIYARGNWWGFCPPSPSVTFNVDYSDWLCSDPNPKRSQPIVTSPILLSKLASTSVKSSTQDPGMNDVDTAYRLYLDGAYHEALLAFETVVSNYPETFAGRRALVFIEKTLEKLGRSEETLARLMNASATYRGMSVGLFADARSAYQYIKRGQYEDAVAHTAGVVQQNADTTLVKFALYDLGSIHWYCLGDTKKGTQYFSQLVALFPHGPLSESALVTMGESASASAKQQVTSASTEPASDQLVLQNYPNPFNPATQFTYHVAAEGFVALKVYDLLGREVAVLVNEEKLPGRYSAIWHASNVPTGLYFTRLEQNGKFLTRKVLLVR